MARGGRGEGGRQGEAWRAAGRRGRSAGSWCAGEWAPGGRGAWCGREPAHPAPQGPVGHGKERGAGPKFLLELRLRGRVYREALDCLVVTLSRVPARGLCGSPERSALGPGTLSLSSGFGGTPALLPQAHRRGFRPSFFPQPQRSDLCLGGPPAYLHSSCCFGPATELGPRGHSPQPSAPLFKEIPLSITQGPLRVGHFGVGGLEMGALEVKEEVPP